MVRHYMQAQQHEDGMFGGQDVVGEIDETKFGMCKKNCLSYQR